MDLIFTFIEKTNMYLSDYLLCFVLAFSGIFFTFKTGFVQVRCFPRAVKTALSGFGKKNNGVGISSFQALMTSVGAQVGTGNIIGVSSAILTGGPGAVFWIWVMAFFGMATAYSEAVLAQQTRFIAPDMSIHGGPVHYIKKAFPGAFGTALSRFFALATVIALGFVGCAVQSNAIANTVGNAFSVPSATAGVALAIICAFIFKGGLSVMAKLSEKMVPLMAVLYITGCIFLLICKWENLPRAFYLIFFGAVRPDALIGGTLGYAVKTAVSQGVKRGLFSNEAGMGSAAHAHALADAKSPHEQGMFAMVSLFIDTFIVLTLTALSLIVCFYAGESSSLGIDENNMAQMAFSAVLGDAAGYIFIALCLFFFAFSSLISWNFFGRMNFIYLFGKGKEKIYILLSCCFIFMGSIFDAKAVWSSADLFGQLMVIPNVAAIIILNENVRKSVDIPCIKGIISSKKNKDN